MDTAPQFAGQTTIEGYILCTPGAQFKLCCSKALHVKGYPCVCALVTECPDHGRRHVGTHD